MSTETRPRTGSAEDFVSVPLGYLIYRGITPSAIRRLIREGEVCGDFTNGRFESRRKHFATLEELFSVDL